MSELKLRPPGKRKMVGLRCRPTAVYRRAYKSHPEKRNSKFKNRTLNAEGCGTRHPAS